jgi:hypothetical protein
MEKGETVKSISVRSMKGSVSKVGNKYRYQIRVEGQNESNCGLGWSGVTINVPVINSREQYSATDIQMSSVGCSAPLQHGPGDMIFGFRADGSFGEKAASCLFMESVREQWPPHEPIALEAVLITQRKSLDFQVRVWSNRPENGGALGDPDWKTTQRQKDQQGIPAYAISVRFHLLSALKNLFGGLFRTALRRAHQFAIAVRSSANMVERARARAGRRGKDNAEALKIKKDFVNVYPRLCVVCTSRARAEVAADSANWVTFNHACVLGTYLRTSGADETLALIKKYERANGFCVHVMCEVDDWMLLSEGMEDIGRVYLDLLKVNRNEYRAFSLSMDDISKKTGVIRFCWYFKK